MFSTLFAGAYAGLASGAILLFLSHVAPRLGAGNFIRDLDEPRIFGHEVTRREAHLIGVLMHLVLSLVSGFLFALAVDRGWVSGFHLLPILGWSVMLLLFTGVVVMPLEGHGFFGVKHDAWFPVDAMLTNIFWALIYLGLVHLWLP